MQIFKDEVRNAILNAARDHFYENGFENSSTRDIARSAGLTVGNLYRYFKNKEEIFEVIAGPVYSILVEFVKSDEGKIDQKKDEYDLEDIIGVSINIAEKLVSFRKEAIILFEGSKGSKYQDAKKNIIDFMTEHIKGHFSDYTVKTGILVNPDISHSISVAFVEGVFDLYKNYEEESKLKKAIEDYSKILLAGFVNYI